MMSYLEFVNAIDLRELHVVVKQGLSNDVQDAQPLRMRKKMGKKETGSDFISSALISEQR